MCSMQLLASQLTIAEYGAASVCEGGRSCVVSESVFATLGLPTSGTAIVSIGTRHRGGDSVLAVVVAYNSTSRLSISASRQDERLLLPPSVALALGLSWHNFPPLLRLNVEAISLAAHHTTQSPSLSPMHMSMPMPTTLSIPTIDQVTLHCVRKEQQPAIYNNNSSNKNNNNINNNNKQQQ